MALDEKIGRHKYQQEIQSMLYTFGDVRNSSSETACAIEDLVRSQLIELVLYPFRYQTYCRFLQIVRAGQISSYRGSRYLGIEDLMFIVRHDVVKVARLKEFLSWKDVRKNAKPVDDSHIDDDAQKIATVKLKRRSIRFGFDFLTSLVEAGDIDSDIDDDVQDPEAVAETYQRLAVADRMTSAMTKEQYMEYAECRQASFTYKKVKKFREWLNPGEFTDFRLGEDVMEILGFLACELVRKLTVLGLKVKRAEESTAVSIKPMPKNISPEKAAMATEMGLFALPDEHNPLQSHHVTEAYRLLQFENASRKIGSFHAHAKRPTII